MHSRIHIMLAILVALTGLHCGAPTGGEDNPELAVTPTLLDFGEANTSLFVTISNIGSGTLHWSVEVPSEGWIEVGQREGNITNEPVAVDVRIDRESAPAGEQEVTLVVTAEQGGRKEVTVKVTIQGPELAVTPTTLDFGETRTSIPVTISNTGGGTLHWSIEVPSEGWISLSRREGNITRTEPATVDVTIDREKAPTGQQDIILRVIGGDSSEEITLRATIRRPAILSVSPTTLSFGETASQQQVMVRNDGGETMTWSAFSAQTWITFITPSNGTLAPGDQQAVTVSIDRAEQTSGSIQGTVDFTSSGGSVSVIVQATVPNLPRPSVSPTSLDFGQVETRLSVELRNIGGATLDWTLEVSDAWIRPTTTSGSVLVGDSRQIYIQVSREGIEAGAYQGSVTFLSVGGDVAVNIFMKVSEEPVLGLSEESLEVGTEPSFAFSLSNTGSGDLLWDITESEDWLALDPVRGTTTTVPQTISGSIAREGLEAGAYATTIRITSNGGEKNLALTMEVPLPSVEITRGPEEGEILGADQVTFEFRVRDAYGDTEFSTKLNDGDWSVWSDATEVTYEHLEESSLVGVHLFQVRVRADAGEIEEPLLRRFEVDAVQGPAMRLSPKALTTRAGQEITLDIVVEEVDVMLAARVVLNFDANKLELQRVEGLESFLGQHGGTIVQPDAEIDHANGTLDLSIGVVGGTQAGVGGTGVLARLVFRATTSGVAQISWGSDTALRDLDNRPISVRTLGITVTIQ